ncbi:hypothetical protein [Leisingera sp. ANG-M6]|uniref:hypothetical protein n=1 Tax=Leisingera sp. ANG-M6 TaxID=1577900 RepID=UPI00057E7306|nr:hypothetical protein [Leisingera sp. ANG-M6]KIC30759.1 hypothetical protein RA24_01920 [Leisingera sp. ANG-M6]
MTKLFMQFHRFEKLLESSVNRSTGNWRPLVTRLNGRGSFVYDVGQDIWDYNQEPMKADGFVSLEVFFCDEENVKQNSPRFEPKGKHFWLTPLGEEGFEYSLQLSATHVPWFLEILKDCETEGKLLTSVAVTEDETKELRASRSTVSEGRFLMRPYKKRILTDEETEAMSAGSIEGEIDG